MGVLFSSTSGPGHVIAMLRLARAFRAAGHQVRWATAAQATSLVTAAGIDAVSTGAHGGEERTLRGAVLSVAQELPGEARRSSPTPSAPRSRPPLLEDAGARLAGLWAAHGLDVPA